MKHDIRDLFKQEVLTKKKLPTSHREDFLKKLQEKKVEKQTNKELYIKLKVAVSIAAILAFILIFQQKKDNNSIYKVVDAPIDSNVIESNKDKTNGDFIYEKNKIETITETLKKENPSKSKGAFQKSTIEQELNKAKNPIVNITPELVITEKATFNTKILPENYQVDTVNIASNKSGIKVNSEALLFSITHSRNEVLAYYKENNLSRESVIKDIEFQLKESHLVINAEDLLIEIESGLHKKSFKEKLLAKIKLKIKELSTAIATN